jgi:hypothetical protein
VLVDLNAQRHREFRSEGTGPLGCPVSDEILGLYRHQFPLVELKANFVVEHLVATQPGDLDGSNRSGSA